MRTFSWFFYTWGDLSTHAFNSAYVKAGWALVGLSPLSPEKMMEAWAFLPDLLKFNPDAVNQIKNKIPICSACVSETGTLLDDLMDSVFYDNGGIFSQIPNSENDTKDTSEAAPVNHRCSAFFAVFSLFVYFVLLQTLLLDVKSQLDGKRASTTSQEARSRCRCSESFRGKSGGEKEAHRGKS